MKDSEKLEALEEALMADTHCNVKLVRTIKHLELLAYVSLGLSSVSFGMFIGLLLKAYF